MDGHLAPVNDADARNLAGTVHPAAVGAVGGQRAYFQKGGSRVKQQVQTLPHREFILAMQAFNVALRALKTCLVNKRTQRFDLAGHGSMVFLISRRTGVQLADDAAHADSPKACTRTSMSLR